MTTTCREQTCPCMTECPIGTAMKIIGGKWKLQILCSLIHDDITRYGELRKKIKGITNTMLSSSLKDLESDGLVVRMQYNEMPLRVEYFPTDSAKKLMPIIGELAQWSVQR